MQREIGRERPVEVPQELQEFLVPMTAVALADDLAGQHVQRGEQRGRAVPLIVVGHGAAPSRFHRQARLGAVERQTNEVKVLHSSSVAPAGVEERPLRTEYLLLTETMSPPRMPHLFRLWELVR